MTECVAIESAVRDAAARLADSSESPRLDAELLVARAIDMPRSYLFAHPEDTLDPAALERLEHTLRRRQAGEPMAYITGTREFWSLELMVSPATLVPRPETERLVELALREIPRRAQWSVLDLGTGSGAIALAIASERRGCRVTATDIRPDALAVARENARQLMLDNLEFLAGDWTAPVAGRRFRLVVANPPYVAADDPALAALAAEPAEALVAGPDGLDAIRRLARECRAVLEPGGALLLEHGASQAAAVAEILAADGWAAAQCYDDHSGRPRVTRATYESGENP
ncbi:MAG: peptide chain release factor N(5)-glutamine methyltransferase [Woeseiaceae bacterium]|nr:peptide chain release factor N(5)-glutamine methyltransferase [Woeseiaceae bacterium]